MHKIIGILLFFACLPLLAISAWVCLSAAFGWIGPEDILGRVVVGGMAASISVALSVLSVMVADMAFNG